jgi:hypothetical protein
MVVLDIMWSIEVSIVLIKVANRRAWHDGSWGFATWHLATNFVVVPPSPTNNLFYDNSWGQAGHLRKFFFFFPLKPETAIMRNKIMMFGFYT